MINHKSIEAVKASGWSSHFCKPLYESYCFSQIPGTLMHLLGQKSSALPADCWKEGKYDAVILILIDGFGWEFLEKNHTKYPFLSRFFREGIVSKLTSQFPSTTAAHITTLCSGSNVGQTGTYEWFYYEPQVGRVIAPLLFSYAGDKKCGTLQGVIEPKDIFPHETVFQKLKQQGISSYIFQPEDIACSPYSNWMFRGGEVTGYKKFSSALSTANIERDGLFYFYYSEVDSKCHKHGIESKQVEKAIEQGFQALEEFWQRLSQSKRKIACMVTADHGMTMINPKTTIFLNQKITGLESMMQSAQGKTINPAGSCRDYFLHLQPEKLKEAKVLLTEALEGHALVCETKELIEDGFFGKGVSNSFLERVGNLVILPYGNNSIWWYEKGKFDQRFFAMHGGLTRPEMETIFLFNTLN